MGKTFKYTVSQTYSLIWVQGNQRCRFRRN